jgi:hypothetical protein
MTVREHGGRVWFEPGSIVTYVPPPPVRWSDLPYFLLRWSKEWTVPGRQRFMKKWGLPEDSTDLTRHDWWRVSQRLRCVHPLWDMLGALGVQRRNRVAAKLLGAVDFLVTRQIARRRTFQGSMLPSRASL